MDRPDKSNGGSIEDVVITWEITKLAVPLVRFEGAENADDSVEFSYTGSAQSPVVVGYNER